MQLSQVDLTAIHFAPLQTNKGVKTSNATSRGGPCEFLLHPTEWFSAPFGASTFDKDPQATRLTMELDVTSSEILPLLQQLDQWVVRDFAITVFSRRMWLERTTHACRPPKIQYDSLAHKAEYGRASLLQVFQST